VIGLDDVAGVVTDADPGSDVMRRLGERVRIVPAGA
jgi:hypothetical protein